MNSGSVKQFFCKSEISGNLRIIPLSRFPNSPPPPPIQLISHNHNQHPVPIPIIPKYPPEFRPLNSLISSTDQPVLINVLYTN